MSEETAPPVGYLRRVRFAFTDMLTGEHREGVWDQNSILTAEEVAHQVFSSLGERDISHVRHAPGQAVKPCPRCGQALVDTGDGIWCHAIGTKDCEWRDRR